MKYVTVLSILVCAVFAAPSGEDPLEVVSVGNRQFAAAVYKEILKTNQRNVIFSPISAITVLALTSEGAKGDTRKELIAALHLPDDQNRTQRSFKELLPQLEIDHRRSKLYTANKIFADVDITIDENFKEVAVEVYESGIDNVNFKKNVEAADTINNWVDKQTEGNIKELIKSEQIDGDTALVLVNALYLNARWPVPFKSRYTKSETFYKTAKETVNLPTMSKLDYFNYHETADAKYIQLRYNVDGLSMVIALPKEKEGLSAVENDIENVFKPKNWKYEAVDLKLPKFAIDSEVKLVDILKSLGVKKIFDKNEADLSGISASTPKLYVLDVIQKAFINVTETGTEAAAATAIVVENRSGREFLGEIKSFHVEHPFIYFIKYKNVVLFAGKYSA